jgi:hypothetical protein
MSGKLPLISYLIFEEQCLYVIYIKISYITEISGDDNELDPKKIA